MNETFGQLVIRESAGGRVVGVPGEPLRELEPDAATLAAFVRIDGHGRYRPLSGAKTLPSGWQARTGASLPLEEVLEAVYPLALVHRRQLAEGTLRVVGLDDVLNRQSGRYAGTSRLSAPGRALATEVLCGECVRKPVWAGQACGDSEIPCPEPCSVFVALCREAALWEAETPPGTPPDPAVAWADFEQPGNELRERFISRMLDANE